jgi:hypothetical protein
MFRPREFLDSLQNHFSFLFRAVEMNRGIPFTNMEFIPFPEDTMLRQTLQMQLWDYALEKESYECFHSLSLFTDTDILFNVLQLAIYHHQVHALVPLIACLERNHQKIQLGNIQCTQKNCKSCSQIRDQLLIYFAFEDDWLLVRNKLKEAKQKNLWIMWKPQLLLNPQTDVITKRILEKNKKGWTTVFFASLASMLWRRWIERQLHPSSSYVNNVLSKRFSNLFQKNIHRSHM